MEAGQGVALAHLIIGTYDQVVLFVPFDVHASHLQVAMITGGEIRMHRRQFQHVADGEWIENGLQVVVAIAPFGYDVQTQIDLGNRPCEKG